MGLHGQSLRRQPVFPDHVRDALRAGWRSLVSWPRWSARPPLVCV